MSDKKDRTPRQKGDEAEETAAAFLRRKGCRIIERNYHSRYGEIDLIVKDGDVLAFVEVKSSITKQDYNIGERINLTKRRKMAKTAVDYLQKNERPAMGARFDVILMRRTDKNEWKIEHIPDAFVMEEGGV